MRADPLGYYTLTRVFPRTRLRAPWKRPARTLYLGGSASPAPSNLSATAVSISQIDLTWDDNASDETEQELQYGESASFVGAASVSVGANVESCSVTLLDPGTTYYFRIRAVTPGGNSDWSNVASATTDEAASGGRATYWYQSLIGAAA